MDLDLNLKDVDLVDIKPELESFLSNSKVKEEVFTDDKEDNTKSSVEGDNSDGDEGMITQLTSTSSSFGWPCSICDTGFTSRAELVQHAEGEHSCPRDRPYRCQECGDCLYSYSSLRIHQLLHHGENSKCPHCNAGFAHADLLRAHVRRSHADILLKIKNDSRCELCNVVCGSKDKLKNHNRAVHKILKDKQVIKCDDCGVIVLSPAHLMSHKKVHGPGYSCVFCPTEFLKFSKLCMHRIRCHPQERKFRLQRQWCSQCEICNVVCESGTALSKHYRDKHYHNKRITKQGGNLNDHEIGETIVKVEQECILGLPQNVIDIQPMDMEEGDEINVNSTIQPTEETQLTVALETDCQPLSSPNLVDVAYLTNHFPCECGDMFLSPGHLSQHKSSHGNNFKCTQCGTGFKIKHALIKHKKRVHSDVLPLLPNPDHSPEYESKGNTTTTSNEPLALSQQNETEIDSDDERFLDQLENEGQETKVKIEFKLEPDDDCQGINNNFLLDSSYNSVNLDDIKFKVEEQIVHVTVDENIFL